MSKQAWILLFLLVVMLGIEVGANFYEARVLVPYSSDLSPELIFEYITQRLSLAPDRRFWSFSSPLVSLLGIANLITAWRNKILPAKQRKWWIIGSSGTVLMIIASFAYFIPTWLRIQDAGQPMASVADIQWWVRLNWLRAFVYAASWLATLRALSFGRSPTNSQGVA